MSTTQAQGVSMLFKELFKRYKIYTIVGLIVLIMLVAGGTTAGVLLTKQDKEQLNIVANAADFSDSNGLEYTILSSTDLTVSVSGYSGAGTEVIIPETVSNSSNTYTVTTIAGGSSSTGTFSGNTAITSITIPSSITTIQNYAFYNCTALNEINFNATAMRDLSSRNYVVYRAGQNGTGITVNIGANVESIPAYLFFPYSNSSYSPYITAVDFAGNSQCESIGNYAFAYCDDLTEITIPASVTSIGECAFNNCRALTEINFNATNMNDLSFSNYVFSCAGQDGTGITVNIGANVIRIPAMLFYPFSSNNSSAPYITAVNFLGNSQCESIGEYAFRYCDDLTEIVIPNSVTSIEGGAFYQCNGLTNVTIPNSVTSIGVSAFSGCGSLTSIIIPNSVTSIGSQAFYDCTSLTEVTIPNSVTSIENGTFYDCSSLTSITIPNSVTSIGGSAFYQCNSLTSVTIPNNVTSIGDGAFSSCESLTSINVNSNNSNFCSTNGILFNKTQTTIVCYPAGKTSTSYTIPNSVTSIGVYAFRGCSGLTSVTIPDNVTSIEDRAFYDCSSLISITIPNSVTSTGTYVFQGCTSLTSVTIVNGVTSIGSGEFYNCTGLTSITIPNSVISIGDYAFSGCTSLDNVYYAGDINDWVSIDFGGISATPLYHADNLYLNGQTSTPYTFPSELDLSNATKIGSYSYKRNNR